MDVDEIENLSSLLKTNEEEIAKGIKIVTLTTHVLDRVNKLVNIHIKQLMINNPICIDVSEQNCTETIRRDIQIIYRMMQTIAHLKLIQDIIEVENTIDISEFRDLRILEIQKFDVTKITGFSSLRLHLKQLICRHSVDSLKSLLEYCGGDFSSKYVWTELKSLVLSYNNLTSLDDGLECTPWITTLDLSHNQLTFADEISCLSNLKQLNISYNKLKRLPKFSGQICNRLQVLNVSNNFLEDILELKTLVNLSELDLSENCLIDHTVLVSLSHMATLIWISLIGNPLAYHACHFRNTCIYLHSNIEPSRFILDYKHLTNNDIKSIGTFHPLMQKSNSDCLNLAGGSTKHLASSERYKKVREVDIEDNKSIDKEPPLPIPNSYSSIDHLEVKNHVQNLREIYGESWLNYYKGINRRTDSLNDSQDISGFAILDETSSNDENAKVNNHPQSDNQNNQIGETIDVETPNVYNTTNAEESSEDEDIQVNSEETIYMAKILGEETDLFIVFTNDSLTEVECTTSKERANWILNTVAGCEYLDESHTKVEINFDTLRKDKKQRIYVLNTEDAEMLYAFVTDLVNNTRKRTVEKVYQCMKCLKRYPKIDDLLVSYKDEINQCPSCGSTILVEENIQVESS